MKRMIVVLAVLLMAAPAMAAVTITAVDEGGQVLAINFTNDEATGKVRAFALDIVADGGALIIAVPAENTEYDIHPGSIVIDPCDPLDPGDGTISNYGQALCDSSYPGTQGGLGTIGVTVELASLYESVPPSQSGLICKVQTNGGCNVTVSENTIRGGIVMENPAANPGHNLNQVFAVAGGCACKGELVADSPMPTPVTALDCFQLIGDLTADAIPPLVEIYPGEPGYSRCGAEIFNDGLPGGPAETALDCFALIGALTPGGGAPIACLP